jgi:hypothetical protein
MYAKMRRNGYLKQKKKKIPPHIKDDFRLLGFKYAAAPSSVPTCEILGDWRHPL